MPTKQLRKYRLYAVMVGVFALSLGLIVITAWIFDIKIVKSVLPGFAAMDFNTAICFVLLGITILLQKIHYFRNFFKFRFIPASVVALTGLLTFFHRIFKLNYNIDTLLYNYPHSRQDILIYKTFMSPQAALGFICLGLSIFFMKSHKKNVRIVSQYLIHLVTLVSFVSFVGYIYGVPQLYSMFYKYPMPLHTTTAFLIMSAAMSLINPYLGLTAVFTGNLAGNLMARRLFFSMTAAIVGVGYLRILSHRYQVVDVELGIALLTIAFVLTSFILIFFTSHILNDINLKNKLINDNFKKVIEASPFALIVSDRDGKITMVNSKTESIYGYTREELLDNDVNLLIPERLRVGSQERRKSFFSHPEVKSYGIEEDLMGETKNGEEFPLEAVVTPIKSDRGLLLLAFVIDITERKANEEIIKKHLTELQYKNQELEQFNYIASHDLQEPLRTVSNYIQLLEEDYPEQITGEINDHLKVMNAAVNRMVTLVRSLLDFGKLGRNKKLKLINCNKIINEVLTDLSSLINQKDARVEFHCCVPEIYAYETELRQIFQNLINNAVKFSRKNTKPYVRLSCESVNGYYKFSVADNGIGIDSTNYDKIFHIFQRLNSADEYEGHGIGLANCKKIAEMHGGKIWAEPAPEGGTIFIFTILNFKQ